ncbi:MAG TPA: GNAT family N-acetyltransferase [Candidatus Angelobacter sp.]|jgi:GNAT superfamily N-acetyltransferase|nr:GNAT family N-acetyltransferase [Candidatus Angelobacter sp.]
MAPLTVRPYRLPDDAEALSRIFADSEEYHRAIDDLPPLIPPVGIDYARQRFATMKPDDPERCLLVAEVGGEVVGHVEAIMRRDEAAGFTGTYVDELAVSPSWRGRGVGTALMAAVEEWARGKGALSVALDHLHTNEGAHRLYERLGFRTRGVIMERRLR